MSTFGSPGGRQVLSKPTPPERGSFPLDHFAECKTHMTAYLACLKQARYAPDEQCRALSKAYLGCRMERNLMAKDSWDNLGFQEKEKASEKGEAERERGVGG